MTLPTARMSDVGARRSRVDGDGVVCHLVGTVRLDRCRECVYLLKLEIAGTPPVGQVVCADSYLEAEFDFAW